jgi:hypothetical protein
MRSFMASLERFLLISDKKTYKSFFVKVRVKRFNIATSERERLSGTDKLFNIISLLLTALCTKGNTSLTLT